MVGTSRSARAAPAGPYMLRNRASISSAAEGYPLRRLEMNPEAPVEPFEGRYDV